MLTITAVMANSSREKSRETVTVRSKVEGEVMADGGGYVYFYVGVGGEFDTLWD